MQHSPVQTSQHLTIGRLAREANVGVETTLLSKTGLATRSNHQDRRFQSLPSGIG